jgi:light-regulated signal transduction histidine kinase (bacteriophytochrome)
LARAPEPAAIQPGGFLLATSPEWLVEQVSANIGDFFAVPPDRVVGRPLTLLLGGDACHSLRNQLALLREPDSIARLFGCEAGEARTRFDFTLQLVGRRALIEGQPSGPPEHGDAVATIRALIGRLEAVADEAALFDQAARQLRALTGFDRVGVYRLDDDGARLAASTARSLGGLPASIGPAECDQLAEAPLVVADRDAAPVTLIPPNRAKQALNQAPSESLRAALRKAGATAALTIPVRAGGQRWGTIVCHHPSARAPDTERQSALGLYAHMLGLLLEIRALERRA